MLVTDISADGLLAMAAGSKTEVRADRLADLVGYIRADVAPAGIGITEMVTGVAWAAGAVGFADAQARRAAGCPVGDRHRVVGWRPRSDRDVSQRRRPPPSMTTWPGCGSSSVGVAEEAQQHLTAREREVMSLVGRGLSNAEIAEELFLSPLTAKTHVSRAMIKLHTRDRAQLVVIALRTGLTRVEDL